MGLRLYNTLTRTKQEFDPIDPGNIRMYVCGPTVYDFAHIGNARPLIVFDVLFRLLKHLAETGEWDDGKGETNVTYVRNITDVDDKINARAATDYPDLPLNEAIRQVTTKTEKQFLEDAKALGCRKPTHQPRATEHIAEMKAMIETLVTKDYAYVAEDHVYFRVAAMKDYGRLSNRSLDEMIAGARVEIADAKRDAGDFVLWKPSKHGEPAWPSPQGIATPGRPGWHLECSAMSDKYLWEYAKANLSEAGLAQPHQFDIHGGGIDLVFPHHENEIAQSRCVHGTPAMANIWMHNGFLQVEGEKMSKSLGNFVTIRNVLEQQLPIMFPTGLESSVLRTNWNGLTARLAMMMTHYRQPLDWTRSRFAGAHNKLSKWLDALIERGIRFDSHNLDIYEREDAYKPSRQVAEFLCDDLNTPALISFVDQEIKSLSGSELVGCLKLLGLWGAGLFEMDDALRFEFPDVDQRVTARAKARNAKDFAEADRIRDELDAMGIALKDSKDPDTGELVTTWEVKR